MEEPEEVLKESEYYKEKIRKLVSTIDNIWILERIVNFIVNIQK